MDKMAARDRTVDGKAQSLIDLGYNRIGMDDNWQACGTGYKGSFHTQAGVPLWNTTRFPDVKKMNAKAHQLGLKSDWYINNCICSEKGKLDPGFVLKGNAQAIADLDFDGTKIDGCGQDHNVTEFALLVDKAVGGTRPIVIEDCNDDPSWDHGQPPDGESGACVVSGGGFYRIGGDIFGTWEAIMGRIQPMSQREQPNQWHTPKSRPGCWPTPDALEVGCSRQGPLGMNVTEARSHFGLWVITSSPLILGLDLRDDKAVDLSWPIITNTEALAVNRAWPPFEAVANSTPGRLVAGDGVWAYGTTVNITWQVWAKNISASAVAVLLLNAGPAAQDVSVALTGLLPAPAVAVHGGARPGREGAGAEGRGREQAAVLARDLWNHKELGPVPGGTAGKYTAKHLAPHDSHLITLRYANPGRGGYGHETGRLRL